MVYSIFIVYVYKNSKYTDNLVNILAGICDTNLYIGIKDTDKDSQQYYL